MRTDKKTHTFTPSSPILQDILYNFFALPVFILLSKFFDHQSSKPVIKMLQNLSSDILGLLFSFIIVDVEDFSSFVKVLMAWLTKQTTPRIRDVLQRLDWDSLYQFHNNPSEVTREQFHGFISFAVRHNVDQALYYNSIRSLFLNENVPHHLDVLSSLSGNHFPSYFCFIFFKTINRTFHRDQSVQEMYELLNQTHLRYRIIELIKYLEEMYCYLFERDHLLPIYKFCPNARNKQPIYQLEGHPLGDEMWNSLCTKTIESYVCPESEVYGNRLTMAHMWNTDCGYCKVQILLFKILLSSVAV